jgi:hypothetical protein
VLDIYLVLLASAILPEATILQILYQATQVKFKPPFP